MRKQWARWGLVALVVGGAVAALAANSARNSSRTVAEPRILPVATVEAVPVTRYRTRRTYTGTLVAARAADLSLQRAGEIVVVHVDQGDKVGPGDVLATLDTKVLETRRRELVAQRAAAVAVLDELNAGTRPETIAVACAQVRNLEAQVKLQQQTLARRESLIRRRAVSQAELDEATFGLQSAEASRDAALQKLAELEAGPRAEKKLAQRAAVEQLDAAIAVVDAELEDSQLVAPFRGTVTARMLDEGAVVAPGQVVLRLVEDSQLEAWFGLPVSAAELLQPGAPQTVRVGERECASRVKAVVPELDQATRTRRVVLALEELSGTVFPGEIARLDLEHEISTTAAFWLPTTALVRGGRGLWNCLVVEPAGRRVLETPGASVIEKRDVTIIYTAGQQVLVDGMLSAGDAIVVEGAHRFVPGQLVHITRAQ